MKIFKLIICLILLTTTAIKAQKKKSTKPNIILIYADDMGRGMLSNYGQKYFTTPNIDRLADQGMRFNHVYGCNFCAPARASLISGMHDAHLQPWSFTQGGVYMKPANEINVAELSKKIDKVSIPAGENEVFLATVAKNEGYVTAEFGKLEWGFATSPERIKSHDWDYHFGYYDHRRCHGFYPPFLFENGNLIEIPGNTHVDCGVTFSRESPENYKKRWDMTGKEKYSEYVFMEKALKFIDENNPKITNKPFFMYYSSQLPHGPVSVPEVDAELKNNPDLTEIEKEFGTMVKILDNSVGKLYNHLDKLGLLENTIIIFTGDNGHEVPTLQTGRTEDGKRMLNGGKFDNVKTKFYSDINGDVFDGNNGMAGLKRASWEGGVRVPLYWFWKGKIAAGTESNQLVANYDILNTLSELIGGKNYHEKDSKSYSKTLLGSKSDERDYTVFSSKTGPGIVTKEGWKLRYENKKKVFQLYYLPKDYREENVLNEKYPNKVKELKAILLKECDGDLDNGGYPTFSFAVPSTKEKKH
ncbi:sulfatase-like hydrolase/transferase [Lutibacter citreus]|uniref:sulfatase-like hydrolase/transferase n=1 Tax=Lutibacter citreus TaxID=2138210 RepID=UPI000DBE27F1|nr:sulfatase-like hydrolase/transferase [Lutibacter citreus]